MSAFTSPILIRDGQASTPSRITLAASDSAFAEGWLQEQLFRHPGAIPLKEIAPNVGDPIPICKELNTVAGPADILYVTTSGQVVLVETKLWRNPEARRTVVAQILDYAKELTAWTYEELSREVARATGKGPGHLLDAVRAHAPDLDESQFVDGINHSLRTGDIVLLIVGDGIRTGAQALVGFLESYGSLRFTFGLVEVAAYELGPTELLLQPRVLAKTEIVRRIVVVPVDRSGVELLPDTSSADAAVPADTETGGEQAQQSEHQQWLQSFWIEFMGRLRLDDSRQPTPKRPPRGTNAFFPMPPGGAQCWISAYLARTSNHAGVYIAWTRTYTEARPIFEYLQEDKAAIEKAIEQSMWWNSTDGLSIGVKIEFGDWDNAADREKAMVFLLTMTNRFVNVFRPRLEAFFRARTPAN